MNEQYDAQSASLERSIHPEVAKEYLEDPDKLFGDRIVPQIQLKTEQPWHRLLLYFKGRGLSNIECARKLGTSEQYVGQIARQPWFRLKLVRMLKEEGLPGIQEMIRGAAPECVLKLIELRDDAKKEEVQRDCAMDLLDRYLGKAPQVAAPERETIADLDEKKLDAEIAALQRRVNQPAVGGQGPPGVGTN
jgi:hypothetical protein